MHEQNRKHADTRRLILDLETTSACDLRRTNTRVYSRDPTTLILCMAWTWSRSGVVEAWDIRQGWRAVPQWLIDLIESQTSPVQLVAHNAAFEIDLLRNAAGVRSMYWRWSCTMARAAYWGLPLSLDGASRAAGLSAVKNMDGRRHMLKMARPRMWTEDGRPANWWHKDKPDELDYLVEYCKDDVRAEDELDQLLPELPTGPHISERELFTLDLALNARGMPVDMNAVKALQCIAEAAKTRLARDCYYLTGGITPSQPGPLQTWINAGIPGELLPDLRKDTVHAALLRDDIRGIRRDVLEIRERFARTSAAKLDAMEAGEDCDRVAGLLQYSGAGRTHRWAGRLIQVHNLPRGMLFGKITPARLVDDLSNAWRKGADVSDLVDLVDMFSPLDAMATVASCLRACFKAPKGHTFVVGDYAQIEARLTAWFARQREKLAAYAAGKDMYVLQAADIFGIKPNHVDKPKRQIGKVAELSLGFGGGRRAFKAMGRNYGIEVSDDQAESIKVAWRASNRNVVVLWDVLDKAAKRVVAGDTDAVRLKNGIRFQRTKSTEKMFMQLPSGTKLTYWYPRIVDLEEEEDHWKSPELRYKGVNQYTGKWDIISTFGGKLLENAVQATARDLLAWHLLQLLNGGLGPRAHVAMHVHDEIVVESQEQIAGAILVKLLEVMKRCPAWLDGLPIGAEGFISQRYRKG